MSERSKPAGKPTKKSGPAGPSGKPLPDPGKVSTRSGSPTGKGSKGGDRKPDGES